MTHSHLMKYNAWKAETELCEHEDSLFYEAISRSARSTK